MSLPTRVFDGVALVTRTKAVCQSVWPRQHIYGFLEGKIVSRLHEYKIDTFPVPRRPHGLTNSLENQRKTKKIKENQRKSKKIQEKQRKLKKIKEN